jgi:Flp pilus assembly protein TadD
MAQGPTNAEGLIATSIEHLNRNEPLQAERAVRQALASDPVSLEALGALGLALHIQAKHRESEQVYLKMTVLEPSEPMHWMNVGTARRCDGRIDDALYAFAKAAALGGDSADLYYNVALAHIGREDYESARTLLEKACKLDANDAEIRYRYALCCYETLRAEEALAALDRFEQLPSAAPEITAGAGHLLMLLGDIARAEPLVRGAALQGGGNPGARLTLVQLLERTNRTAEARGLLDQLRKDPVAAHLVAEIRVMEAKLAQRESRHESAVALLKEVAAEQKKIHLRHSQLYPLAQSLDALGRFDEAFEVLTHAHASQLAHLELTAPLAASQGAPTLSIADQSCDPQDLARWDQAGAPAADASPIFIVGFPRSGTTLLELVLDAHPDLKSIDEQPFLQNALVDILAQDIRYPRELAKLSAAQLADIRASYWARARRLPMMPHTRLIDKNPLNILRLPVIKRLFPNAKILLAVRHPCDVVLSCFMQHFREPDFVMLCQSIPTLAAAYRKTFDFWYSQQELLRADSFELRYESFVEDFQADTRRVFDFLEVPWNDAVLAPAKRATEKLLISTPSYSQVVQPVSAQSVGRWNNYRTHFEASLPVLAPYLHRWGYPG